MSEYSLADVNYLLKYIANDKNYKFNYIFDYNKDGKIDLADVNYLLKHISRDKNYPIKNINTEKYDIVYNSIYKYRQLNTINLNHSDNWIYYRPDINSNIYYLLTTKTNISGNKLEIVKFNKKDESIEYIYYNDQDIKWNLEINNWLDVKVIYTSKGDYAYVCTETGSFTKYLHIYDLSKLYSNNKYTCVNSVPLNSFHNIQIYQNKEMNIGYLYCVGGQRNALEIYDILSDPINPFYLGGYKSYPEGYTHIHTDDTPQTDKEILYIHDICVEHSIPGLSNKIIGFCSCMFWSSIVVLDLTDPINVKSLVTIVDKEIQDVNIGIHHTWISPNKEFLFAGIEGGKKHCYVVDLKSIFEEPGYYYNNLNIDLSKKNKFFGKFQIVIDTQKNYHNQYCYKIKNDIENFILLTSGYINNTIVQKINYKKLRENLENLVDVDSSIIDKIVLVNNYLIDNKTGQENIQNISSFAGTWNSLFLPNSNYIFDSCSFRQPKVVRGTNIYKLKNLEVENDVHFNLPFYKNIVSSKKQIIIGRDPLYLNSPEFYKLKIQNHNPDNIYEVYINSVLKTFLLNDNNKYDIGHLKNDTDNNKEYNIKVDEFENNNTIWSQEITLLVPPHKYMSMNDYTSYNKVMLKRMHPDITLQAKIDFTYSINEVIINNIFGYNVYLNMTEDSIGKFSFENVSFYDDKDKFSNYTCHCHWYIWEDITGTGQDMQGESYIGYHWVKKGRLYDKNWITKEKLNNRYMKISLTSNSHSPIIYNEKYVEKIIKIGNPNDPEPN